MHPPIVAALADCEADSFKEYHNYSRSAIEIFRRSVVPHLIILAHTFLFMKINDTNFGICRRDLVVLRAKTQRQGF